MQFIANKPLFKKVLGVWLTMLICAVVLASYFDAYEAPRTTLELIAAINVLTLGTVLAMTLPRGIWSVCFMFFAAFAVFHTGLLLANAIGGITDEQILYVISFWFNSSETENAIHLVNLGLVGFCLGAILFSNRPGEADQSVDERTNQRIFHIGGAMLIGMVMIFFAVSVGTGAIASYGAYLALLQSIPILGSVFAYIYLFIGLSLVFVSATYRPGYSKVYFGVFAVWALIAFKLGLRGEVMFPGTVALVMLGRRGAPVKGWVMAVGLVFFLMATSVVKNARISGDYSEIPTINPLDAVAEMGSSLRAVQEVIGWRIAGDQLLYGGSYWVPVERQIARFVPGLERMRVTEDPRMLNIVVQERAGPIGFSPVAEAYLNFGERGVLIVMFLFGILFAYFDNKPSRMRYDIMFGTSLVPLFVMIRNSFTHVPVQVILGLIVAWLVIFAATSRQRV